MRIHNTLTKQKSEVPIEEIKRTDREFRMFICGPTVQDNVHIGHAKTYLAFDVLARWLLKKKVKVYFLMNITDVDDKIFDRARKENVPYMQIADKFYGEFLEDLDALNIETVSKFARVSNYVEEAVNLVQQMLDMNKAYYLNKSVYFDTSKADRYGKLSHQGELDLKMKIIDGAPGKRNSVDFLLWRYVGDAREGVWDTRLGPGRPGWHIEDSGIAFEEFGGPYDLHGGATELVFPHHESELAQDEAVSGRIPFVSIWMHTGLLLKDGEKMSKSLGNVVTIREALKTYEPDLIRLYFLKRHYREAFDFEASEMEASKTDLETIKEASAISPKPVTIQKASHSESDSQYSPLSKLKAEFESAMDNDIDTPKAIRALLQISRQMAERKGDPEFLASCSPIYWNFVEVLGFSLL